MTTQEKLKKIRDELKQMFLERADLIDGALSALLSAHHLLIIGPPGTAKSMLADELCRRIDGANYFQWLLTRFTTPEEIFGAVSLKALEQDDYRRVTSRKLPEAHIAFLDEIFKANSSILNSILTLINERLFHNGKEIVHVPLLTLFGASNELPEEEELTALYDRFLLRFVVGYISEDFRFLRMLESQKAPERTGLTLTELNEKFPIVCSIDKRTGAVAVPVSWTEANLVRLRLLPWMPECRVHKDAAEPFIHWFQAIINAKLQQRVMTFNGSYVPRLKRGSGVAPNLAGLSRHTRGIAVDLNAMFNRMGEAPAKLGEHGCMHELVPLANECGIVWGGDWKGKSVDGMHFEIGALD